VVTVGRDTEFAERIDDFLSYLIGEWAAIPELAAEWEEWSPYERSDFALEWPILPDRPAQLGQYDEAALLTPAQRRCCGQLLALVARHRPRLERLFHRYRP
jgi:hypothetical protein